MNAASAYALYLVCALGAAGLYVLLPRAGPSRVTISAAFGLSALAGLFAVFASLQSGPEGRQLYCYGFAAIAILAAARVITHPRPVYSAIYFAALAVAVAAMLVLQDAEFLAVALVIIYAGAILVTYLFVIMLAQQPGSPVYDRRAREPLFAIAVGFVFLASLSSHMVNLPAREAGETSLVIGGPNAGSPAPLDAGNTMAIGETVMTKHVVALELSGVLLLISMVGAIAMCRKSVPSERIPTVKRALGQIGKNAEPF